MEEQIEKLETAKHFSCEAAEIIQSMNDEVHLLAVPDLMSAKAYLDLVIASITKIELIVRGTAPK